MKTEAAMIYGQVIGFVSSIFMLYVFLSEAFLKRGVLYIEPNLTIATVEFFVVGLGLAIQGVFMIVAVLATGSKTQSLDPEYSMPEPNPTPDRRMWA